MISITSDIADLILQRTLNQATEGLNNTINRMTTGYKLNHAKDNAAGYSIVQNFTTKISSLYQVQDNTLNGISLLQTAEGGFENILALLERLRNLTEQAANGTYGEQSREAMQAEADEIIAQIEQIRNSTQYNGLTLFYQESENIIQNPVTRLANAVVMVNGKKLSSNDAGIKDTPDTFTLNSASNVKLSEEDPVKVLSSDTSFSSPAPRAGDISGAVDISGSQTKTITIDGVEYEIKNILTTGQTLSYLKDSSTGELTFYGSNFEIHGQSDAVHNLVIDGDSNKIYTGNVDDTISITDNSTSNYIYAGDGNDIITVGNEANTTYIYGESGDDIININNSQFIAFGGDGNDTFNITTRYRSGTAYGGNGNDIFNINSERAIFYGEGGEDTFNISGDKNTVNGGEGTNSITDNGTNTIKINVPGANAYAVAFKAYETRTLTINGIDYTVTNRNASSTDFNYSIEDNGQIVFSSKYFTIKGDANKAHNVNLTGYQIYFYGGNLDDIIDSTSLVRVYAGEGNNTISVTNYSVVYTGDGDNTVILTGTSYISVNLGNGNDTVIAQATSSNKNMHIDLGGGDNTLTASTQFLASSIYAGEGNNTLNATFDGKSMISGFGDSIDNAEVLTLEKNETKNISINGIEYTFTNTTSDRTTCLYSYNPVSGEIKFGGGANVRITGQADVSHNVVLSAGRSLIFYGGDLNDNITSYVYGANVYGQGGNDIITMGESGLGLGDLACHGGDGNDIINIYGGTNVNGDNGDDTINIYTDLSLYKTRGDAGNDTYNINAKANITDTGGDNIYNINTDNASVSGSTGNDTFYVNGNNNTVLGGGGDDYFVIDGENNTIDGGTGKNFYVDNSSGTSTIINTNSDPNSGGLSFTYQGETLTFTLNGKKYTVVNNLSGSNMLQYSLNPNTGVITLNGSDFTISAESDESAILNIRGDNNTINGSSLNDRITIEQGTNNTINGNDGDDTLITQSENNSIYGGAGNDSITLNASTNQTVDLGSGNDSITINSSNNTNINLNTGNNRVTVNGSDNTITGIDGNNTITVNNNNNEVRLGEGDNKLSVVGTNNSITVGNGDNTIGIDGDSNILNAGTAAGTVNVIGDGNSLSITNGEHTLSLRGNNNRYTSTGGNKEINIVGNTNTITTGSGDDVFDVYGNGNSITTASGTNTGKIEGDTNIYQGGAGTDDITLRGDNNTVKGGESNDSFMVSGGSNNIIDGEGGDRNTLIDNGYNTQFSNAVDITPRPFELNLKVDLGTGASSMLNISISFNLFDFGVDFSSQESALKSLERIDELISTVQEQLINIGSTINRLESVLDEQQIKIENLISARSTIQDADIAEESSDYIRYQILQQASSILMASSRNLRYENVIGLLSAL